MTRCNPRIINPSIHLQLQRTGDEQGCPPDQYRPARCGNPNMEFVKPAPSAIREGYGPIPGSEILQIGDDNGGTPGRYRPARCGNPTPVADWPGFVKPPAPGEYTIPSSEQNAFFVSTTPINRGRKWLSPRRYSPVRCGNPTVGTPLLAGVREAGGLHQLGARRFSKFVCHDLIGLILFIVK